MTEQQIVIYRAGRPHQAELLANLLAESGIQAIVHNDALQAALGEVPFGWATSVRVVVRAQDAEAREIAEDFDRQLSTTGGVFSAENASPDAEPMDIDTIEVCPDCGRARMTSCPYCKTSSAHFPSSTGPDRRLEDGRQIVVCTVCDEPFQPVYLKTCEWCGHEFSEGSQQPFRSATSAEPMEFNERMLAVIVGIVAVVGATVGYFAWLLRE